jgi:hypothetical protein
VRQRSRLTVAGFAAAAAAATIGAVPASAARQVGSLQFTSKTPGAPTGIRLNIEFVNPDDPNAKPYAAAGMVITGPRGARTDTTVPPQCHASDPEIMLLGHAACPAETQIGGGFALSDNGPGANPRFSRTTIKHFNNQDEVVGIGVNDDIPALKFIDRTRLEGRRSRSTFPLVPGLPPPEPFTPVKRLSFVFPRYTRAGRAYQRTPRTCPRVGYWTFTLEFPYRDGVTESIRSRSPCRARRAQRRGPRFTG